MPFFEHLEELRQRLFRCAAAFAVGLVVAAILFYIPGFDIVAELARPITPYLHGQKLVYTHPGDAFQIAIDVAFSVAFVVALPVILYQLWGFISPAMYEHERRVALPVVLGIVALFICGVVMAFMLILPLTLRFLIGVETGAMTPMITATEYFGFAIYMCMAFGAAFELPIVIMGLTAIGIVKPDFLAKYRRYAIVGGLVAGGFITPDPTSMFVIAIPLYALYELGIFLSRMVYRWRLRREEADEQGEQPPPSGGRGEPRRLGAPA